MIISLIDKKKKDKTTLRFYKYRFSLQAVGAGGGPWGCSWYAKSGLYVFLNRSGRCAAACDADILWSQKDKKATEAWMAAFATVCLISVTIAILSLLKPRKQSTVMSTAGKKVEEILLQNSIKKCC